MKKYNDKTVLIFDFDGTIYSGVHKFDNVPSMVHKSRRLFLPHISDEEYTTITKEFPNWNIVTSGKDIVDEIYSIKERYPNLNISTIDFWDWQNESRYDIVIDWSEVIDIDYLYTVCDKFTTYIVSNSSPNHLLHYMDVLGINPNKFRGIISNRFEEYDRTKEHYYKDIMEIEDVPAESVWVIGDSDISDLAPARNLNMNTIFIDNANDIKPKLDEILKTRENI
jgi:FMN phosphatase YigB (HAD superfamily)